MNRNKPVRVSREHRCPVCGKPDWCMVGEVYVLCMRVQSDKPKTLRGGETGWLHPRSGADPVPVVREPPQPQLNVERTLNLWGRYNTMISTLSASLGVSGRSLEKLGVVHAPYHNTWAFPMRTGDNGLCGIRLRNLKGDKWAERGSHQGLFIPQEEPSYRVMIVEGPTDCAAAITLGYYAIGRPSCSGGVDHLIQFIKRNDVKSAIIVADLDDPGLDGAKRLQELVPVTSCILTCPAKDLRTFLNHGGNRPMLEAMIGQLIWEKK